MLKTAENILSYLFRRDDSCWFTFLTDLSTYSFVLEISMVVISEEMTVFDSMTKLQIIVSHLSIDTSLFENEKKASFTRSSFSLKLKFSMCNDYNK